MALPGPRRAPEDPVKMVGGAVLALLLGVLAAFGLEALRRQSKAGFGGGSGYVPPDPSTDRHAVLPG